ncbi:hypothetical protein BH10ACT3_BH10ACT3_06500 [soil metagenome]
MWNDTGPSGLQSPDDEILESNAYAVAYRLLGDRPAARAVAGIATQRLRQATDPDRSGQPLPEDWLALLTTFTVEQTVGPAGLGIIDEASDPNASLRAALRRRLERATPEERVAGALVHLAGYPVDFVASVLGTTPEEARSLAGVLAPPPGVAYRDLGDPELTGGTAGHEPRSRRRRRPHWTTIVAVIVLCLALFYATQVTGPRPTLVEEGSWSEPAVMVIDGVSGAQLPDDRVPDDRVPDDRVPDDRVPADQRNAGPLTQLTSE